MLSKVLRFFVTPSFWLAVLDFALAAAAQTVYVAFNLPFFSACAAYWFILGAAAAVLAWKKD